MNFKSFSQNVIDSTFVKLKNPIARLVIKDLISGDGAKQELILLEDKINLLNKKIILKDSIIFNLNSQVKNFGYVVNTKTDQLKLSQQLSKKLEVDLKKQKFKNTLTTGVGIIAIIGTILVLQ